MRPVHVLLPILAILMIGGIVLAEQSDGSDAVDLQSSWTSGQCTVMLDDSGTVTVTGSGALQDYASASDQPWYSERASMVKLVIKDGVTGIGNNCFRGTAIRSIDWPSSSLTSIWNNAFLGTGLIWVSLPSSVTTWGNGVFQNCGSLSQVELPSNMTSIPNSMFMNCTSLVAINIPTSVETIGVSAFGNTGLTSVFIPDEVETIGNYAFQGCTSLVYARVGMGYDGESNGVFAGCTSLVKVGFSEGLLKIGEGMFNGCTALISPVLPLSLRTIGANAFANCTSLVLVVMSSRITQIDAGAFNATALGRIVFQGTTWGNATIGNNAFASTGTNLSVHSGNNCANGKLDGKGGNTYRYIDLGSPDTWTSGSCTLTLDSNSGLMTISGNGAMLDYPSTGSVPWYSWSGTLIRAIKVGNGVTKIGNNAFYDDQNKYCGLNRVYWDSGGQANLTIGDNAFRKCYTLERLSLPSSCVGIGDNAFNGCRGIRSLTLPAQLTSIGSNAFNSLHSLIELDLNLFTGWNYSIFNYTNVLQTITCSSSNTAYSSVGGVLFSKDGQSLEAVPYGRVTYTIPSSALSIGSNCARGGMLGKITIPSSVTSVNGQAFVGCTKLTSIDLPAACVGVSSIAFADCINVRDIYLHGSERYTHSPGSNAFNLNRNSSSTAVTCNVYYDEQPSADAVRNYLGTFTNLTWNVQEEPIVVTIRVNYPEYGTVSLPQVYLPAEGGSVTVEGNRINIGGTWVTATPSPQTDQYRYVFDSWQEIPFPPIITEDMTITAVFTREEITYNAGIAVNEDEWGTVSTSSVSVLAGTTWTSDGSTLRFSDGKMVRAIPSPQTTEYRYAFDHWEPSSGTVSGDVTITAVFTREPVEYTVLIRVNHADWGTVDISSVSVPYNTPVNASGNVLTIGSTDITATPSPSTPYITYGFDSWGPIPFPPVVTEDITITANFTRDATTYTVTYNGNGGTPETQSEEVEYNEKAHLGRYSASKEGYAFLGWNTDQSQIVPLSEYTVTADATLYAVFVEIVEYDIPAEEYIDGITHTEYSSGGLMGTLFMVISLLLGLAIIWYLARNMGIGTGRRRYRHT